MSENQFRVLQNLLIRTPSSLAALKHYSGWGFLSL